ncbi:MAG: hypothetical protein A4E53_00601 [Pelotomaculum sp. PtaB.Bin104]|nr:MAG: hypothetical protein A4E53_00601 [Pelotomaculum sp. PtaB.Bin104]
MSIYKKNMEVFQKWNPDLAKVIDLAARKKAVTVTDTSSLQKSAQIVVDGRTVWVHSSVNPEQEAKRIVKNLNTKEILTYFVLGMGLGYVVKEILKQKIPKAIVVIVEPDPGIFKDVLQMVDMRWICYNPSIIFYCGEPVKIAAELRRIFLTSLFFLLSNVDFIESNYIRQVYPEWAKEARFQIQNAIRNAFHSIGNDVEDTIVGLRQIFQNIKVCLKSPGLRSLEKTFSNTPAIIVSAGPSLKKNIHLLKEAKGRALILAVDTTLRTLLNAGVVPDAVFSVERVPEVYEYHFKNLEIPDEVVLVALPVVQSAVFESVKGPKLIGFRQNEELSEWVNISFGNKGVFLIGGSVAHQAFSFARFVGADPIIFVGQDLAYGEDFSTHSEGTVYAGQKWDKAMSYHPEHEIHWVPGYYGQNVPTNMHWRDFITWFENQIALTTAKCINATEGGALIKGAENMPLGRVLKRFCQQDMKESLLFKIPTITLQEQEVTKQYLLEQIIAKEKNFLKAADYAQLGIENFSSVKAEVCYANEKDAKELLKEVSHKNTTYLEKICSDRVVVHFTQPVLNLTMTRMNYLGLCDEDVSKMWRALQYQQAFFAQVKEIALIVANELKKIRKRLEKLELNEEELYGPPGL